MEGERRDGHINFVHYSLDQLRELKYSIDSEAFPLNAANLSAEIARREAIVAAPPDAGDVPQYVDGIRFTRSDGWPGWFQAKQQRLPLYGGGSIELREGEAVLHGWQRTWLGVPERAVITIPAEQIWNAATQDSLVRFEWRRSRYRRSGRLEFRAESADRAAEILSHLPTTQTAKFGDYWPEVREFSRQLDLVSPRAWCTPALVLLNLIVFVWMAIAARSPGAFNLEFLWSWGANYSPQTLNGQPWRLLTALFLHANAAHVALNMIVLWNVGRLTERLYGTWTFALLYLTGGVLANLTSTLWSPDRTTVGASGAVFAVVGAFLAYLMHSQTRVPRRLARAHWLSTGLFALYNLASGALQPDIDNAAHVGGLIGGFALGWLLARPLESPDRLEFPFKQAVAAAMLALGAVLVATWLAGAAVAMTIPERFYASREWFARGEAENLGHWARLEYERDAQSITLDAFADQFRQDIVPFWRSTAARLRSELRTVPAPQREFATLVVEYARERLDWATELGELSAGSDPHSPFIRDFARLATATAAHIQVLELHATSNREAAGWSGHSAFFAARNLFRLWNWSCIESRDPRSSRPAPADSLADGPALAHLAGCRAQKLLISGEYATLDASINNAALHLNDLPDGRSTLEGYYSGLNALFQDGGYELPDLWLRMARWRRAVPHSAVPELLEAEIFSNWAWSARGGGYAKDVTGIAWQAYAFRSEMAAVDLDAAASRANADPLFYVLSLNIDLDKNVERRMLNEIFDNGTRRFPAYIPLYRAMLRILEPRWGGSYEEIDRLIKSAAQFRQPKQDQALYARLYWSYSSIEDDEINIFNTGNADWPSMKSGFRVLTRRYPDSDFILNGFAKFACVASDREQYAQLRPMLTKHISTVVWSPKVTLAGCDKALLKATALKPRVGE